MVGLRGARVRVTGGRGRIVGLLPRLQTTGYPALLIGHESNTAPDSGRLFGWRPVNLVVAPATEDQPASIAAVAACSILAWAQVVFTAAEVETLFNCIRQLLRGYAAKSLVHKNKTSNKVARTLRKIFISPGCAVPSNYTGSGCICPLHDALTHSLPPPGWSVLWAQVAGRRLCTACAEFAALYLPQKGFSESGDLVGFFASTAPVILSPLASFLTESNNPLCRDFAQTVLANVLATSPDWLAAASAFGGPPSQQPPDLLLAVRRHHLLGPFPPPVLKALGQLYPEVQTIEDWRSLANLASRGLAPSSEAVEAIIQPDSPGSSYSVEDGFIFRVSTVARLRLIVRMFLAHELLVQTAEPVPLTVERAIALGVVGEPIVIRPGQSYVPVDGRRLHVLVNIHEWPVPVLDAVLQGVWNKHPVVLVYPVGDSPPGLFAVLLSADPGVQRLLGKI